MLKPEYWIISTFSAIGIIGGLSYLLISSSALEKRAPIDPGLVANNELGLGNSVEFSDWDSLDRQYQIGSRIEYNPADAVQRLTEEGDGLLTTYQIAAAQTRYQAIPQITGELTDPLLLRLALCAELTQQPGKAARFYHRILKKNDFSSSLVGFDWTGMDGIRIL